MSHVPHDLHAEFPAHVEQLHQLKLHDSHFQRLAERYHELNREIHRIETDVAATSDHYLEDLKKQRLTLLDTVAARLAEAKET